MANVYLSRANHINDRLCDVYQECFKEMVETARDMDIRQIVFSKHKDIIDVPCCVFEKERFDAKWMEFHNAYEYEELESITFNETYNCITLNSRSGIYAYMDETWGDFFDITKIGNIYKAFMEIIGKNNLKDCEIRK